MEEKATLSAERTVPWDEAEARQIALASQDPRAFAALYDRYVQPVYRYLLSRVGDVEEARDLTSQTFLTALEAFPRYRHNGHFPAWLFSIARSRMVDHWRRRRREDRSRWDGTAEELADPLQPVDHSERLADLRELVRGLKEDEQELLRLRFVAGLAFAEMAELLGRGEGAVKKSLYRLLDRLHHELEEPHG